VAAEATLPEPAKPIRNDTFSHPVFWALLSLAAVVSVAFALRFFAVAFPVVGLDIAMDRESAMASASQLAAEYEWGPEDFRQAASFGEADREVRTYLELELGVDDAFTHLVQEADFHPYAWRVRHFAQGERTEVTIRFTPAGERYGFTLQLPEDEPGAALDADEARSLAEEAATEWGVDLALYRPVEASQEVRPGGRVDHTFVYEREGVDLGDADARVRLRVAGDRPAEVLHLVRVPEAFSRRYQEIRSANESVALAAAFAMILILGLGGCGGGIFFLVRRGALVWRPALAWGLVVSALTGLTLLNGLPLAWMGYDTAVSEGLFLGQQWMAAVGAFLLGGGVLAVIFMAAEGLTRLARPREPMLWKLWSPEVASTRAVVGRTVGGYLLAAIHVGFVVGFYLFATRREGWWMPSEALVQPDLVANYLPSLTAISISLLAGFWEESLFRAVPVAIAVLLGARFGAKGVLVGMALVFQALVFAAGHADYPQQPAYARVVELVVPATIWGLLYLRFGLLPVILAHALYNLTWFSIPIFAAPAGLWVDRVLIVAVATLPLLIVLRAVRLNGIQVRVPDAALNESGPGIAPGPADVVPEGSGAAGPPQGEPDPEVEPVPAIPVSSHRFRLALAGVGAVGALLWILFTPFSGDVPPLEVNRAQAMDAARQWLVDDGVELGDEWTPVARVQGSPGASHRFVWQEGEAEAFQILLEEGYLRGPSWLVRFVRFTGPVEERAEEFRVVVGGQGGVERRQWIVPEDRPGAELEEAEARSLTHQELRSFAGLDPDVLDEVSAQATSRPERVDWRFTWSHPDVHPMDRGDARVQVALVGDTPSDAHRFVHIPEEWEREERERATWRSLLGLLSGILMAGAVVGAAIVGVIRWARAGQSFPTRVAWSVLGVVAATTVVQAWNRWPTSVAGFGTARPFRTQLFTELVGQSVSALLVGVVGGLTVAFAHAWLRRGRYAPPSPPAWGVPLGLVAGGAGALLVAVLPSTGPTFLGYGPAGARIPALSAALDPVVGIIFLAAVVLLVLAALDRTTDGWSRSRVRGGVLALAAGIALSGDLAGQGLAAWLTGSVLAGVGMIALFLVVRSMGIALVPVLVTTVALLPRVRDGLAGAYPGSGAGGLLAVVVLLSLAAGWAALLEEDTAGPERPSAAQSAGSASSASG
jgi:hypothetical protein